jgi:spore coat polysaccharide biosynthesis predicted glycosyltransferase SpsG
VAAGLETRSGRADGVARVAPGRFRPALSQATVAILGGGLTLYEAAALGVPAVAVSVVAAQRAAVRAFADAGAALDAGPLGPTATAGIVRGVVRLLADRGARLEMSRRGPAIVDGRGAVRAAWALGRLAGLPLRRQA